MQRISEATLLDIWDAGHALEYNQRALLLLRLSEPGTPTEAWLDVPVGQRNAALLQVRRRLFGNRLVSVASCPDCGQWVECHTDIDDLLRQAPAAAPHAVRIALPDATVSCRLPTARDIDAVISAGDPTDAAAALLARCFTNAEPARDPTAHSPEALQQIDEALSAADPLAHISFLLHCDSCSRDWDGPFDVVGYLWEECTMDAKRLLVQVHTLAAVYHWSESCILKMSERRRQFYLECIGA